MKVPAGHWEHWLWEYRFAAALYVPVGQPFTHKVSKTMRASRTKQGLNVQSKKMSHKVSKWGIPGWMYRQRNNSPGGMPDSRAQCMWKSLQKA